MPPTAKWGSPCPTCASTSTSAPSRPERATDQVRPSPWLTTRPPRRAARPRAARAGTGCRRRRPAPAPPAPAGVAREVGGREPPQPQGLGEGDRLDRLARTPTTDGSSPRRSRGSHRPAPRCRPRRSRSASCGRPPPCPARAGSARPVPRRSARGRRWAAADAGAGPAGRVRRHGRLRGGGSVAGHGPSDPADRGGRPGTRTCGRRHRRTPVDDVTPSARRARTGARPRRASDALRTRPWAARARSWRAPRR